MIAFNLALIAAILSPGPAFLVAVQTTLSSGRKSGVSIGLGLGLMAGLWTLAALLGLDAIFELFPAVYVAVKILGSAYLIYLAIKMWRSARETIKVKDAQSRHAFFRGLVINLFNPKSVLFAAAMLVVVFPKTLTLAESALVVANHLVVEIAFYVLLAFGMSSRAIVNRYLSVKAALDRTASLILGTLGIRLLTSR